MHNNFTNFFLVIKKYIPTVKAKYEGSEVREATLGIPLRTS